VLRAGDDAFQIFFKLLEMGGRIVNAERARECILIVSREKFDFKCWKSVRALLTGVAVSMENLSSLPKMS
jgi:hypothetical protein